MYKPGDSRPYLLTKYPGTGIRLGSRKCGVLSPNNLLINEYEFILCRHIPRLPGDSKMLAVSKYWQSWTQAEAPISTLLFDLEGQLCP